MATRRLPAVIVAVTLALAPVMAQQQAASGLISGNARDEAKKPYTDYNVQLVDTGTGMVVTTQPLDDKGLFAFQNVGLGKKYLVVLFSIKRNHVVCSEGPYLMAAPDMTTRANVTINCGAPATALWLLLAGAGTATAIAATTQSPSR